jgi:long-chain acyl-CoA synthetase
VLAAAEQYVTRHPLIGQACVIGHRRNYLTALLVLDTEAAPMWARQQGIPAGRLPNWPRTRGC